MKKIICMLLILTMALGLCACANPVTSMEPQTIDLPKIELPETEELVTEPEVEELVTEPEVEELVTEPEADSADDISRTDFLFGVLDSSTYTNQTLGFACTVPDGWEFFSAEDLQSLDEFKAVIENKTDTDALPQQIDVMQMYDVDSGNNVNIVYAKPSEEFADKIATMTEDQLINLSYEDYDMVVDAYKEAGMSVIKYEKTSVQFLGHSHPAIYCTINVSGIRMCTLQIVSGKSAPYVSTMTVIGFDYDAMIETLDLFYPI